MNQHDLDNIRFLLNRTPAELYQWYQTVSDQDLVYASEIMEQYARFLESEIESEIIEKQLAAMPVLVEAQAVIAAVRGDHA